MSKSILIIITLLLLGGCSGALDDYPDPESVYLATFNTPVPATVKNLRATGHAFGDSSACYLRFDATLATVNTLTGNSFTPITAAAFKRDTLGAGISGPTPNWWKPSTTNSTTYFNSTIFHPGFFSGSAYMSHDSVNNATYLYWDGCD